MVWRCRRACAAPDGHRLRSRTTTLAAQPAGCVRAGRLPQAVAVRDREDALMPCRSCGRDNRGRAVFCDGCGAHLTPSCRECGHELRPDAHFCDACGAAAVDSRQSIVDSPRPSAGTLAKRLTASPATYTPKHLADKILQSKSALEGERKQVTVLFADVKGSMDLAEQLAPAAWHEILARFF